MAEERIGTPGLTEEEEIIEKKPSSPMATALLMIVFVVLIVGTYLNWSWLGDYFFRPGEYEQQVDARKIYKEFDDTVPKFRPDKYDVSFEGE
jgi:hypothetical protein